MTNFELIQKAVAVWNENNCDETGGYFCFDDFKTILKYYELEELNNKPLLSVVEVKDVEFENLNTYIILNFYNDEELYYLYFSDRYDIDVTTNENGIKPFTLAVYEEIQNRIKEERKTLEAIEDKLKGYNKLHETYQLTNVFKAEE